MKKITLIALAFVAFSCSYEEEKALNSTSILGIAKATPELSTFVQAVELAGLTETLENADNVTVFVPDNAAFASLLTALGAANLSEVPVDLLADVLTYHVIGSEVLSSDLSDGLTATTLFGQDITINIDTVMEEVEVSITDGNAITTDAIIGARDVRCSNGVIHRIDTVLLPNLGS